MHLNAIGKITEFVHHVHPTSALRLVIAVQGYVKCALLTGLLPRRDELTVFNAQHTFNVTTKIRSDARHAGLGLCDGRLQLRALIVTAHIADLPQVSHVQTLSVRREHMEKALTIRNVMLALEVRISQSLAARSFLERLLPL